MSDHDDALRTRVRELENAFIHQTEGMALHAAGTNLLTQQLYALLLINTGLVAALRDRDLLDVEQIRTKVLEELSDEEKDGPVIAHVNAMLGTLKPADPAASNAAAAETLKNAARARFRLIDGGVPDTDDEG